MCHGGSWVMGCVEQLKQFVGCGWGCVVVVVVLWDVVYGCGFEWSTEQWWLGLCQYGGGLGSWQIGGGLVFANLVVVAWN